MLGVVCPVWMWVRCTAYLYIAHREDHMELKLETKGQRELTGIVGEVAVTPPITSDYWTYRVAVGHGQAVVGFPEFFTIGIGFQEEEDWNTNLPFTCSAEDIYAHIEHNKGNDAITREDCLAAIRMVQEAAAADEEVDYY